MSLDRQNGLNGEVHEVVLDEHFTILMMEMELDLLTLDSLTLLKENSEAFEDGVINESVMVALDEEYLTEKEGVIRKAWEKFKAMVIKAYNWVLSKSGNHVALINANKDKILYGSKYLDGEFLLYDPKDIDKVGTYILSVMNNGPSSMDYSNPSKQFRAKKFKRSEIAKMSIDGVEELANKAKIALKSTKESKYSSSEDNSNIAGSVNVVNHYLTMLKFNQLQMVSCAKAAVKIAIAAEDIKNKNKK